MLSSSVALATFAILVFSCWSVNGDGCSMTKLGTFWKTVRSKSTSMSEEIIHDDETKDVRIVIVASRTKIVSVYHCGKEALLPYYVLFY